MWICSTHGKCERKRFLSSPFVVEGIKMEWILKKEWWKDLGWINLAQGCCEHGSEYPEYH
jgi:hypothetical protein